MPTRRTPAALLTAALLTAGALLSGCAAAPVSEGATSSAEPAAPATVSAAPLEPTPEPTPTETVAPPTQDPATATPVEVRCKSLVPVDLIRVFGADYARDDDYEPDGGTYPAQVAALDGTACGWTDATTDDTVEVAVAKPSDEDLLALQNDLVERSNSVPTYEEEAYFSTEDGVGEVNAFHEGYWIVARSTEFFEPGDATAIVRAAIEAAEDA